MKNQLEVTLALSQGADYILMDEPFSGSDLFNREDFYRVMLGLLSDHETVILSTHLLEEVKTFLSRAVLLRQGRLIGDTSQQEMEDAVSYTHLVRMMPPLVVSSASVIFSTTRSASGVSFMVGSSLYLLLKTKSALALIV